MGLVFIVLGLVLSRIFSCISLCYQISYGSCQQDMHLRWFWVQWVSLENTGPRICCFHDWYVSDGRLDKHTLGQNVLFWPAGHIIIWVATSHSTFGPWASANEITHGLSTCKWDHQCNSYFHDWWFFIFIYFFFCGFLARYQIWILRNHHWFFRARQTWNAMNPLWKFGLNTGSAGPNELILTRFQWQWLN